MAPQKSYPVTEPQNLAAAMLRAGYSVKHTVEACGELAKVLKNDLVISPGQVQEFLESCHEAVVEHSG